MDAVRQQLAGCVKRTFDFHRTLHPGETFYAFALVAAHASSEALMAISETEESFTRRSKGTRPSNLGLRRFCPDEWWFDPSHPVGDDFGWSGLARGLRSLYSPQTPNGVLNAMIDTLAELDRQGYFGHGVEREKVTLMTYISDDPISKTWWPESIRRLNPPAVVDRFTAALKPLVIAPGMPVVEQLQAERRIVNWPTLDQIWHVLDEIQSVASPSLTLWTPAGGKLRVTYFPGLGYCVTLQKTPAAIDLTLCDLSKSYGPIEVAEEEHLSGVSFSSREMAVTAIEAFFRTGLQSSSQTWMNWMELDRKAGIE